MRIDPFPGVLEKKRVPHTFKSRLGKVSVQTCPTYVLTDAQREWLVRWFPETENSILMRVSGMKFSSLHRFARTLGLTKSDKGMHAIKRRQAAHIKKTCEKNGYYASLRGKPVSEACRNATAQMWEEIREGKREHPRRILERTNPRKYKRWLKNQSEARKDLIRREKRRVLYGIGRTSNIVGIVLRPYTRTQCNHRCNALKRGYIVMADCSEQSGERYNIYFDDQTERAPIFERNLVADGFTIKPLPCELSDNCREE